MNEITAIFEKLLEQPEKEALSIVVPEAGRLPVVVKEPFKPVGADEIRVMMVTMGYCGRDKSIVTGQKTAVPGRIGHEGAGIVIDKGKQVDHVDIGQNILIFPFIEHHNIGYDWPDGGKGIFSTFPIIPKEAAIRINKDDLTIQDWLSLSLIEPFSGVGRGLKRANIIARDAVIILGAGPIGCAQTILAKYLYPAISVILVDKSRKKLETAQSNMVPADDFILSDDTEKLAWTIDALTERNNPPLIIHSNPYKHSLKQAITIVPDGGTVLLFSGIYDWKKDDNKELGHHVTIDPRAIHYEEYDPEHPVNVKFPHKEITLLGSRGFTKDDFHESADRIVHKEIEPLPLVTKILQFDENILHTLAIEGAKESNLKLLMSPYNVIVNQGVPKSRIGRASGPWLPE